jgi:hypothetical protein
MYLTRRISEKIENAVAGRRGEPVHVKGGRIEGDPGNATAQLLAGWLSARCDAEIAVERGPRTPGPSGVDSVVLDLDQDETVQLHADRKGGAVVSQPYRPDATVALPERSLGDLLSEELRRLDTDEPYRDALEAATGVTGLGDRAPTREHVWFDPAEGNGRPAKKAAPKNEAKAQPKNEPEAAQQAAPKAAKKAAADPPAGWKVVDK